MAGLITRSVEVLEVLRRSEEPLSIREIASRADLSKSAVQRILVEFAECHVVAVDPATARYILGPRTLAFGAAYEQRLDIRTLALPHLFRLTETSRETTGLSVEYGDKVMHIAQVPSPLELRAMFHIGHPLPLWSGAPSRVILAERPLERVQAVLAARQAGDVEPAAPPPPETMLADIEEYRVRGYAVARGETLEGVSTLSAPLRDAGGALAGIVSITMPSTRLTERTSATLVPALLAAATTINAELGWLQTAELEGINPVARG